LQNISNDRLEVIPGIYCNEIRGSRYHTVYRSDHVITSLSIVQDRHTNCTPVFNLEMYVNLFKTTL